MKEPKPLLETIAYLNIRIKELAYNNFYSFFKDCLFDGERLANDKEVSEILYDAIEHANYKIPFDLDTSKFTIDSLLTIADFNLQPESCKEKLAEEFNIHEQTLNNWLETFDSYLYSKVYGSRKLSFREVYEITDSLGFTRYSEILRRSDLCKRCSMMSSELQKNLPKHLRMQFKKFIKYPPIFSNQVLKYFDAELLD